MKTEIIDDGRSTKKLTYPRLMIDEGGYVWLMKSDKKGFVIHVTNGFVNDFGYSDPSHDTLSDFTGKLVLSNDD